MAFGYSSTNNPAPDEDVPTSVDSDAWKAAEEVVVARNGGFAGVGEAGKRAQILEAYNQIVENNKAARKWEGKDDSGM